VRVLAGGPSREVESGVFRLHRDSLAGQAGFDVTVRHDVVPDGGGERWTGSKIERVARVRQRFLDLAESDFYDGLFMVDTDVVCGPNVLQRLWEVDAPVVYGVFWTVWPGWEKPMPQVWDIHPYGYTEECLRPLFEAGLNGWVDEVEVLGGGACTLFRGRAFESRYWPPIRGLLRAQGGIWAGEDRHYCIGCEARDIRQVAVVGLPIVHLYTPDQQTPESLEEAKEAVGIG